MGVNFTPQEGSALYRMLTENTGDIVLKTDREGYVLHASAAIETLGVAPHDALVGPHIVDLAEPSHAAALRAEHDAVIAGEGSGQWIEFPARSRNGDSRWFEIHLRALTDGEDRVYGALGIMRSIEERRSLEEKLFTAAMTDPLTGLSNRRAFIAMLQHLVDERAGGCLALFDIDHFKAINMHHGQAVGDEVLIVFSEFVRTLMRWDDIISRIGSESLGVLLPAANPEQAAAICRRIVDALSEIDQMTGAGGLSITASVGIAAIGDSLDGTIRRAELALFFAKAKGGNRLEIDRGQPMRQVPGRMLR